MNATRPIPRVIHQVWVGSPLPAHLAAYRATWARLHPTWQHRLWTDEDLGWLRLRPIYDTAGDYVPPDAVGQFKADLARLEILLDHGGLYVDVDTEALLPIDDHLAGCTAWAAAEEDDRWVGNTYLAAVPGHPAIREAFDGLLDSLARNRGARPNLISGPKYLTPIWQRHGCTVAPARLFFPYSYRHVRDGNVPTSWPPDTVAVHHWHHHREVLSRR